MKLKIKVERIEFDAEQCSLRLNGRNIEENEFVKMGQYHTLDLEVGRPCMIEKQCWDFVFMNILNDACDPGKKAEVAVVGKYLYVCFFPIFFPFSFSIIEDENLPVTSALWYCIILFDTIVYYFVIFHHTASYQITLFKIIVYYII